MLFERHSYEEVKQHNKPRPVQVRACDVENIKRVCEQNQLPLIKEYDFMRDTQTHRLEIEMKPTTIVRDY